MGVYLQTILVVIFLASTKVLAGQLQPGKIGNDEPERRFAFENGTYEISNLRGDWYFAKYSCALKGMELVSIESLAEHMAIVAEVVAYDQSFWTSASDHEPQASFYWESTGKAMGPFSNWAAGQPDDGAAENLKTHDCVALNSSDSYLWHDFDCKANSLRFICEKRDQSSNDELNFSFKDVNYTISSLKLQWWKAKFHCRARGMRLASIESAEENEAIRNGVKAFRELDNIWISAADWWSPDGGDFYWDSTGEFFGVFDDWMVADGEPVLGVEDQHCAYLSSDAPTAEDRHRWRNGNCYSQFRFLCESVPTSENSKSATTLAKKHAEPAKSFSFRNSYYEISREKAYWYLAKLECKLKGMELQSIESAEEQEAVAKELGGFSEHFWTSGTRDLEPPRPGWFPYFVWDSTGRLFTQYANWGGSQPNGGNCIFLTYGDGFKWHDIDCKVDYYRYICEKKDSFEDEAITFTFNDSYYEVSNGPLTWWDASRDCRSRGMRLVSIESQVEDAAINRVIGAMPFKWWTWTSGVDFEHEGDFYWDSTGEFVGPHLNWGPEEPNNLDYIENCMNLVPLGVNNYVWNDSPCNSIYKYPFICEKINII